MPRRPARSPAARSSRRRRSLASSPAWRRESSSTRMAFAAPPYDGDVLVVLSLRGGFDGLHADRAAGRSRLRDWRPNIGIPQGTLLQLDGMFGMHPAMAPLKPCYDAGTFGVVHAVGRPSRTARTSPRWRRWSARRPGSSLRTGWLDRVLGRRATGPRSRRCSSAASTASPAFLGPEPGARDVVGGLFGLDAAWDATERARGTRRCAGCTRAPPTTLAAPAQRGAGRARPRRRAARPPATRRRTARSTRTPTSATR